MKTFALFLMCCSALVGVAQDAQTDLTLDQCIGYAIENNIDLKRARNNEVIARANRFQAMMNFLPTLRAEINYDYFFGNFFDTNAARQVTEATNSSNPNFTSTMRLFNGFTNQYMLKRRIQEQNSAQAGIDDSELTVKTNTISFYLNAALSKENLKITQNRVDLLENQLDREEKRVSVGVGSLDAVYNLRSQLSNERLNLTNAQNLVRSNMLALIQSMQLDPASNYGIAPLTFEDDDLLVEIEPFNQVLATAMAVNPGLKRSSADKVAARYSLKEASAQRLPTITFFGRMGSNYSSNGATNPSLPFIDPDTGDPGFNFEPNATFWEQLEYNQFEYLNFTLNIPIFNNYTASRDVQVSKVNFLNAELDYQQATNTITNIVQQAYLDVLNAQTTYSTAKDNLEAQDSNFEFIRKRFEAGNTDFYSYLEGLNNKNNAEAQLINAKYTIVLRKRILDLYKGL